MTSGVCLSLFCITKFPNNTIRAYISEHGLAAFLNNYNRKDYCLKYKGDLCAGNGNGNRLLCYYPSLPSDLDIKSASHSSNDLQTFAASPSPNSDCIPQEKAYPVCIIAQSSHTVRIPDNVSSAAIKAIVIQNGDGYTADREEQTIQTPDVDSISDTDVIVNSRMIPSSL